MAQRPANAAELSEQASRTQYWLVYVLHFTEGCRVPASLLQVIAEGRRVAQPRAVTQYAIVRARGGNYVAARCRLGISRRTTSARTRARPIRSFSRSSRSNLIQRLAQIDRGRCRHTPLFVTLTYPKTYPVASPTHKRHLDTFMKRLVRRYPRAAIVWKLELQARGAPHYHLVVFNVTYVPHQWVARVWYDICGSNDPRHWAAGTEVRRAQGWRDTSAYVAKYVSKAGEQTSAEEQGRFWGCRNREHLPISMEVYAVPRWAWEVALEMLLKQRGTSVEAHRAEWGYYAGTWLLASPDIVSPLIQFAYQQYIAR